jgi:protein pelota
VRVLHQDARAGILKLLPQNPDDLWHLYNLLEEGDLVRAVSYRREERRTDKIRPERGEKRRVRLGVRVERVEFQEFGDSLRVGGQIVEGPEDMAGMGGHHTFTLSVGDDLEVVKEQWRDHQLRRVAEAVEATQRPLVALLVMDDEGALLAQMHQYGVRPLAEIPSRLGGKMFSSARTKEDYFAEVLGKLQQVEVGEVLILLGPGFEREGFKVYVASRAPGLASRIRSFGTSHAGMQGIQEALRSGIASSVLEQSRVAQETRAVERLLQGMAAGGPVAYGPPEVKRASEMRAVETLLITDQAVRRPEGEALMRAVEGARGRVLVVSTHHDAGRQLQAIGGVGALLRFRPP